MQKMLYAVWLNTFNITNAINVYGALGKHAPELNIHHSSFWGLTQRFAIQSAVMSICKIYDVSNNRFAKNTAPRLLIYLKDNLQIDNAHLITAEELTRLGVSSDIANKIHDDFVTKNSFLETKHKMLQEIEKKLPSIKTDISLKRIVTVRDKILAHQEELDSAVEEQVKFLPSLDEMERLNNWAIHLCGLIGKVFNEQLPITSQCSHMATKNVIKKFLGLEFNDPSLTSQENWEARRRFYDKD